MAVDVSVEVDRVGGWGQVEQDRDAALNEARLEFNDRFSDMPNSTEEEKEARKAAWDAYRHAYVSGRLVQMGYSVEFVNLLGSFRELIQIFSSPDDANMDLFNNQIGRGIGDSTSDPEVLAEAVEDSVRDGTLITDASGDGRQYEGEDQELSDEDLDALADAPPGLADDEDEPLEPALPQSAPLPDWVPGTTVPFGQGENAISPLVLDVDGSGTIELAALNGAGSVYWDIDQDGFREASGWITGGDGLLCIDLNSDGVINDHGELFGGANGYVTLAAYDTNSSGTITSADAQFADLRVWIDDNADGFSQASELHTLSSLGITSISTSYSNVNYTIAGNQISFESTFVMNGNTYTSVDAFFSYDNVNTEYDGGYVLDLRTLFLPNLRGYGELPDLHIAMSMDEDLLDMVQEFSEQTPAELAVASLTYNTDIQDILFRWAGVDGVSPTSRGAYIDARILGFLEAFMGREFDQYGYSDPLGWNAGNPLMEAWNNAYEAFAQRLFYQASNAQQLFTGDALYNPVTDTFQEPTGVNFDAVESWIDGGTTWLDQLNQARYVVKTIDQVLGVSNLSSPDQAELEALLPEYTTLDSYMHTVVGAGTNLNGTSDDNLIIGNAGHNTVHGYGGHDVLLGDVGIDSLYGDEGDDTLIGGAGSDSLFGGTGNDTYVFASGWGIDYLYENVSEGTDTIRLDGYNSSDIRLWDATSGAFRITSKANPSDEIRIGASTSGAAGTTHELVLNNVEQIVLDDTTLSLTGGLTFEGTSSGESLYGTQYDDTIYGMDGVDTLYGNRGNDTLTGGAGSDTLYGGDGNDILYGGAGTDTLNGGAGADTFMLELASAFSNQDTIADFSTVQGDKIDIHDIIDVEFDPLTDAIADFVNFTNSGSNSIMSIDRDGTGTTYGFANVATLSGVIDLDETTLYNNGNLLAA